MFNFMGSRQKSLNVGAYTTVVDIHRLYCVLNHSRGGLWVHTHTHFCMLLEAVTNSAADHGGSLVHDALACFLQLEVG